ncbi:leucine-rich_repeat domain-containing protein [Hexamita inflata]|uniref:Leucine-rich repeat domain-containing protein n=1 Tax=Hexamita inflata TaxID=28002 RepID=A0AA86UZ56_9EUKA|nr:leucine-rich repeat domain-containing protein [Hexamita inflata]
MSKDIKNKQTCNYDSAMTEQYRRKVRSQFILIQEDSDIKNFKFVESFELQKLCLTRCDNVIFQRVPSNLKELTLYKSCVKTLTGIKQMTQLTSLQIESSKIHDISELSFLCNLTKLQLDNNNITNISALKELKDLAELNLNHNNIKSLQPLNNFAKLVNLQISDNQIEDLSPIRKSTKLTNLHFSNNTVKDIAMLRNMTCIEQLTFSDNKVVDISPLSFMSKLFNLRFQCNEVIFIQPLNELNQLSGANILANFIIDLPVFKRLNEFLEHYEDDEMYQQEATKAQIIFATKLKYIFKITEQEETTQKLKLRYKCRQEMFRSKIQIIQNKTINSHVQFTHCIAIMFQKITNFQEYE